MDTKAWLIDWFVENTSVEQEEMNQNVSNNYFDKEYIDSYDFISLISAIEEEYGLTFDNDDFLDRDFSTINGLSEIINIKLQK